MAASPELAATFGHDITVTVEGDGSIFNLAPSSVLIDGVALLVPETARVSIELTHGEPAVVAFRIYARDVKFVSRNVRGAA